jgi:hypothetical protein
MKTAKRKLSFRLRLALLAIEILAPFGLYFALQAGNEGLAFLLTILLGAIFLLLAIVK